MSLMVGRLIRATQRAGKLLVQLRPAELATLHGWTFDMRGDGVWWALLFEHAWTGKHPLLKSERYLWYDTGAKSQLQVPYDRDRLIEQLESPIGATIFAAIPRSWTKLTRLEMSRNGVASNWPFCTTRTVPRCSEMNMRPVESKSIAVGVERPATAVCSENVPFCVGVGGSL